MSNNKGHFWSLDENGFILNDASKEKINCIYLPVIEATRQAYLSNIGDKIHSIYLTGSISRGIAEIPTSDLDVFAVLNKGVKDNIDLDWVAGNEKMILEEFPVVSDVQMEVWPWDYAFPKYKRYFSVGAFIIKTHSVCLYGLNLQKEIREYLPGIAIANDDIVQIKPDINEALKEIEENSDPKHVQYWCKRIMKNIIRTGFGLVMDKEKKHTRDLELCGEIFSKYYPEKQEEMARALELVDFPTANSEELERFLGTFGQWIIEEADRWIDLYNVNRDESMKIGGDFNK